MPLVHPALNTTSDEIIVCTSNVTSCGYDNSDGALTNCPMFRLNDSCMISLNVDTVFDCELQTTSDTSGMYVVCFARTYIVVLCNECKNYIYCFL